VFFVQRGNKKYAYKSTSKYVKGQKYPKTVNEYVGILNEDTGEIIPKRKKLTSVTDIESDNLRCKKYGAAYLLKEIAENNGLREDLFDVFGSDGDIILASSMAQAMTGGAFSSTEDAMDGSVVRELLGLNSNKFTSPRLSEFTQMLGNEYSCIEDFFEKRLNRANGILAYDLTSASTHSDIGGWAEYGYNRDKESLKQMNIGLITDKHGIPAMFEIYPGSISDVSTLERTVERISDLCGNECTLVMDRIFGSTSNLKYMLDKKLSFVLPGKKSTKCVKSLLSLLIKHQNDADLVRIHGDEVFTVIESDVAVVKKDNHSAGDEDDDESEYELILPEDKRFADTPDSLKMRAYVCYNPKKAADDMNSLYTSLNQIETKLKGINPQQAVMNWKRIAGPFAKYLDVSVRDGNIKIERKQNSLSYAMNRNGMFVMLSKGIDSWDDMMQCYDCRVYVEQAFDALKNELDGSRWRVTDIRTAKGRMIIKFVALIMWASISAQLREIKAREPVRTILQSMDNIMAVGYQGGHWRIVEMTKKNKKIMESFGVQIPKKFVTFEERQYIPEKYVKEFRKSV